jgi:hypothetical protein
MIHCDTKRGLDVSSSPTGLGLEPVGLLLGNLPEYQKVCGSSPKKSHPFLVLSHAIRDAACPLALSILELTIESNVIITGSNLLNKTI